MIALFGTYLTSSLQIWPFTTIKSQFSGDVDSIPLLVKYHDYYEDNGTLLSICWSNGFVSHVAIPIDDSLKKMSDIISSPRSLTTLCTSFNKSLNESQILESPNVSIHSPCVNKTPASILKAQSSLTQNSTRRAPLFSTRLKFD